MQQLFGTSVRTILLTLILFNPAFAGWSEPVRISEPGGCWYPQILAHGDTLHVVYENTNQFDKISYLRSDNSGEGWAEPIVLSADSSQTVFPRILHNGTLLMALWRNIAYYQEPRNWNIGFALSSDNGLTWTEPLYIINPGWDHILYFSASGSGPVVNVIASKRVSPDLIFYDIRSTNFGENWSEPVEIFRAAQSGTSDQVSLGSFVHLVWSGNFDQDDSWETYYTRSIDEGNTWLANEMLTEDDGKESTRPSICMASQSDLLLLWTDLKFSPYWFTGDLFLRKSTNSGQQWQSESQITNNHLARRSDIVGNADTIRLVWEDEREANGRRGIYYNNSDNGGINWGNEVRLDNSAEESRNPVLAASNGRVYVIWADDRSYPPADIYPGIYFRRYEEGTWINEKPVNLPQSVSLNAYPNPFNSATTITYTNLLSDAIAIYNIAGQRVATLPASAAHGQVTWDGTDAAGEMVSSGIYFARATGNSGAQTIKLVYLR